MIAGCWILNDFLNRLKSPQFAPRNWNPPNLHGNRNPTNLKMQLTLELGCHCVLFSSDFQTSNLKPRNIFCAHLLRSVLFQSIKFISCASLYFGQVFILCKFIFYANFLRGTHFQSISASTVFWQKWFLVFPVFSTIAGQLNFHSNLFLCFGYILKEDINKNIARVRNWPDITKYTSFWTFVFLIMNQLCIAMSLFIFN